MGKVRTEEKLYPRTQTLDFVVQSSRFVFLVWIIARVLTDFLILYINPKFIVKFSKINLRWFSWFKRSITILFSTSLLFKMWQFGNLLWVKNLKRVKKKKKKKKVHVYKKKEKQKKKKKKKSNLLREMFLGATSTTRESCFI